MKIVNLTPHAVRLNSGESFPASGQVARVATRHDLVGWISDGPDGVVTLDDEFYSESVAIYRVEYGQVEGLPAPEEGTRFIVSGLVKQACPERQDLLAPATGHPGCVRDAQGQIVSVPGFVV